MRITPVYVAAALALSAQATWFGGDNTDTAVRPYTTWSTTQLRDWLNLHSINLPQHTTTERELREIVADNWNSASAWTYDQYASSQKAFTDLRDTTFDKWDESQLREFLLKQGVVSPKGPRESLVLMANEKYRQYTNAASSYSSMASATAASMYDDVAGAAARATRSVGSMASTATNAPIRAFDSTKDYVYSTWDEAKLKGWLVEKGYIKSDSQKKKDELLELMNTYWGKVSNPVYDAWSNSYMHYWLVMHNIISPETVQENRDFLVQKMKTYYYDTNQSIWSTWTDSDMRQWLINNNVIKSDAQVTREKMAKMVEDNYVSAKDTFWSAWSDNQLKAWLVEHGYVRSDTQKKRDELVKLADEKYTDVTSKTAAYLTWPDARLRAYLRDHGVPEDKVPGGRPGLLQETRIRWVQTENRANYLLAKIRELANDSAHKVEDVLSSIYHLVSTGALDTKRAAQHDYDAAKEGYADMKKRTSKEYENAKAYGEKNYEGAKGSAKDGYEYVKGAGEAQYGNAKANAAAGEKYAEDKAWEARENVGEKIKKAGSRVKGEAEL